MFNTLVDAQTLHAWYDRPEWVVVDCRHALADFSLGRRQYDEAHIPGAFFADVENDLAGSKTGANGRHPLPDPETFATFLRSLGVNDDTQVVGYDAGGDMFAARLWFLCKWIGHDAVAVLDGGIDAWTKAGFPTTADASVARGVGSLTVRLNSDLVVDAAYVMSHLGNSAMTLLDARASDRFHGQNESIDPVAGHIPGAVNHWFKNNFDGMEFRARDALREAFAPHADPSNVIHQCGSGVSGAVNMLAMEHAGLSGSRLYAGSWSEWIADPSRPISVD